jgi:hypothetical protein
VILFDPVGTANDRRCWFSGKLQFAWPGCWTLKFKAGSMGPRLVERLKSLDKGIMGECDEDAENAKSNHSRKQTLSSSFHHGTN